jgi:DNA recombination protein RmuC
MAFDSIHLTLAVLMGIAGVVAVVSLRRLAAETARRIGVEARAQKAETELAVLAARFEERQRSVEAEKRALSETQDELQRTFSALAADALRRNEQSFLLLASETFDKRLAQADGGLKVLVEPIQEAFGQFRSKVEELEKTRIEDRSTLSEQIRQVGEALVFTQATTQKLVHALRASPQTRGRWGEEQLRNIMELSGLSRFADFTEQASVKGEDGSLRPDVVVRLPGGRSIVIDSKVALDAYLEAVSCAEETQREALLVRHARQLRDHMVSLSSKDYQRHVPETVDFVVMFISGENFFAAAAERDPKILQDALERRVMIVTPVTLTALLKAVALGWRQEESTRNARKAADLGRELHERIVKLVDHVAKLGGKLDDAVRHYNDFVGSLETRVLASARRFEDLEVSEAGATIPVPDLIEKTARPAKTVAAARLVSPQKGTARGRLKPPDNAPAET